jgi:geranylgeranyl pyrophosphate synthase
LVRPLQELSDLGSYAALPAGFARYIERTRRSLRLRLAGAPAGDLLCQYFERGKMLRAFLAYAAAVAVGSDPEEVVMAAEAVELLHGASLFHDDIIDHASHRRGMVALHETVGTGKALVAGDDLLLRAFTALSEARTRHPPATVLEAMEALNLLALDCCRGQFEELCAGRWISEEDYAAIIGRKTAAPFVAAGVLGALLGGGNKIQLAQIRLYGQHLGMAFQIDDDLLDVVGEPGALGKPVGNSLAEGRPMLPLILLWRSAPDDTVRNRLRELDEGGWNRDELIALLEQHGIVDQVLEVRQRHLDAAMAAIEGFPNPTGVEALRALASRAVPSSAV